MGSRRLFAFLLSFLIAFQPIVTTFAEDETRSSYAVETSFSEEQNKEEILKESEFLEEALMGRGDLEHPLDVWGVLIQEAVDLKNTTHIDIRAVTVQVVDRDEQVADQFTTRHGSVFRSGNGEFRFNLAYADQVFLRIKVPVDTVSFIGNNVVFTKKNDPHTVYFIDLKTYRPAIGKTDMPIYKIPLAKADVHRSVERNGAGLIVDGYDISPQTLETFAEVQEQAFNISVNLVDPERITDVQPILESFQNYFLRSLELHGEGGANQALEVLGGTKALSQFAEKLKEDLGAQALARKGLDYNATVAEQFRQQFLQERQKNIDKITADIAKQQASHKKVLTRLKLIWGSLITPQPMGAPKLERAMALVVNGLKNKNRFSLAEAARHVIASPSVQMGVAVASGLALGATYPQELAAFFHQSLDVTRTAFDFVFGMGKDYTKLALEAGKATIAGTDPVVLEKAYFSADKLPKLGVGLTAMFSVIYLAIGVPHLLTNSFYLTKSLAKVEWKKLIEKEGGLWAAIKRAVIDRQAQVQRDYLQALSKEANKENVEFTDDDSEKVERIIDDLEKKRRQGLVFRMLSAMGMNKPPKTVKIETFGRAVSHFLFSYASFTISGTTYTKIWNSWFGVRSFVFHPTVIAAVATFPRYWERVKNGQLPTANNGGLSHRMSRVALFFKDREKLRELSVAEDRFAEVEARLSTHVMRQTFNRLMNYVKESDELNRLFKNGVIEKISDARIATLERKHKRFVQLHYEKLLNDSVEEYLQSRNLDRIDMARGAEPRPLDDREAEAIVKRAATGTLYDDVVRTVEKPLNLDTVGTVMNSRLVSFLSPENNRQVRRMEKVRIQSERPSAMARAVRAMIASNIVDKPLELALLFLCMAGIDQGLLQPIQDEMFSENSWFYLSKMVFSAGFLYGVVSGVYSEIWMKLQVDEQNEGAFDKVPNGKDAEKGFVSWLFKKTWSDKQNGLWKNHKHNIMIIWANMKAALATYVLMNLVTLGRFDLDAYVVGYLFAYFTPLMALSMKIEQGFELASSYFAKDFPDQLRSHPRAQEYIGQTIGRKRLAFNFFYKIYENVTGFYFLMFQQMQTTLYGSRSFSRIALNGWTWTEVAVAGLRKAGDLLSAIPGVSKLTSACEQLIANNYTDFENIPPTKKP